jgi:hypothetical protein
MSIAPHVLNFSLLTEGKSSSLAGLLIPRERSRVTIK